MFLDINMDQRRANDTLAYLRDGIFIDDRTSKARRREAFRGRDRLRAATRAGCSCPVPELAPPARMRPHRCSRRSSP